MEHFMVDDRQLLPIGNNGQLQIVNPRYIVKAFGRKGGEGVRLVLAHRHEPLNAIEPTFEEIEAQLMGVPTPEEDIHD